MDHYTKAEELKESVTREEYEEWLRSPCTQSLLHSIEGDMENILVVWAGGGYTDGENADGTAQQNAKARGMYQACEQISEHIKTLKNEQPADIEEVVNYGYQ